MLSSFPMIATSCGVKKKDVETSNSEKIKNSKPNSESKCRKSRFKETNSQSNSEKEDSKPNSESKCRKSRFKKIQISTNLNAGNSRFRN
nr:hypothetical protein [Mycoplasmopsis bovis]